MLSWRLIERAIAVVGQSLLRCTRICGQLDSWYTPCCRGNARNGEGRSSPCRPSQRRRRQKRQLQSSTSSIPCTITDFFSIDVARRIFKCTALAAVSVRRVRATGTVTRSRVDTGLPPETADDVRVREHARRPRRHGNGRRGDLGPGGGDGGAGGVRAGGGGRGRGGRRAAVRGGAGGGGAADVCGLPE